MRNLPFLDKLIPTGPLANMVSAMHAAEIARLKRADDRASFEIARLVAHFKVRPAANRPTAARGHSIVDRGARKARARLRCNLLVRLGQVTGLRGDALLTAATSIVFA